MIDPKKSKFKVNTKSYIRDSVFDIIDIEEAIKKNKVIEKCPQKEFIYSHVKNSKNIHDISFYEFDFELDNGGIEKFTELFKVIEVLGEGTFGLVISAFDLKIEKKEVAIKVN
jgi:hypothetical protein